MNSKINIEDIKNGRLLSQDELEKLNFHELCLYLGLLDEMEKILKESD